MDYVICAPDPYVGETFPEDPHTLEQPHERLPPQTSLDGRGLPDGIRLGTVQGCPGVSADGGVVNCWGGRNRMNHKKIAMERDKKIALVAHDNKKHDLVEWAKYNLALLAHHKIYATGTTGEILEQELGFTINKLQSGPLGGDQQIGAKIADSEIDFLIFSGIRSNRNPTTRMSRRSCGWR